MACLKYCNIYTLGDLGAKAILRGSSFGLYTPHRGQRVTYNESYPKVPIASVAAEDMTLFDSVSKLGKKMVMRISMREPTTVNVTSRNLIGEYLGRSMSKSFVGVTSHMDTWDVGQGAQDDGTFPIILKASIPTIYKRSLPYLTLQHGIKYICIKIRQNTFVNRKD